MTSSVNPSDRDTVEGGGCGGGCGADVSGIIVSCPGCKRLKVGDHVWTMGHPAYADYTLVSEATTGIKPSTLDFLAAGTIPGQFSSLFHAHFRSIFGRSLDSSRRYIHVWLQRSGSPRTSR